jgi:peptide deformylase
MGEKSLSQPSVEVETPYSPETKRIIEELMASMLFHKGVGLAAPQIGYNKRIIVLGFDKNPRYPNQLPVPFSVLVNPEIQADPDSPLVEDWEGCLSLPKMRGLVKRSHSIRFTARNEHGELISEIATGFKARIIQHEVDHLNGILFVERVTDFTHFGFEEALWDKIVGAPSSKEVN